MRGARLRIYIDCVLTVLAALVAMATPVIAYQHIGEHPAGPVIVVALGFLGVYAPVFAAVGLFGNYRALQRVRRIEHADKVRRECAALEENYRQRAAR